MEKWSKVQMDAEDINKARNFMEAVFEIAFGDNAWMRGELTYGEVLEKLREYSDNALLYEQHIEETKQEHIDMDLNKDLYIEAMHEEEKK